MWENLNYTDAGSLYNSACFRGVTATAILAEGHSEEATKEATVEADRAMAWLKKAVAAGYTDTAALTNNEDLSLLHERADFRNLIAQLTATPDTDQEPST
jgi:hypothetical protein